MPACQRPRALLLFSLSLVIPAYAPGASAGDKEPFETGAMQLPAGSDRVTAPSERKIPAWARDTRWYEIDVPRFFNGDPSNDPPGTLLWFACEDAIRAAKGDKPATEIESCKSGSFGGDLQGVRAKLGYLKDLGVNTLYLDGIWGAEGHNLAPDVSARGAEGDRVLVDLLADAHKQGFRLVLNSPPGERLIVAGRDNPAEAVLAAVTRKWMDPNGDGDTGDGVDGWRAPAVGTSGTQVRPQFRRQWYDEVKKLKPDAVVLDEDLAPLDAFPLYKHKIVYSSGDSAVASGEVLTLRKAFFDMANSAVGWTSSLAPAQPDGPLGMRVLAAVIQHLSPFAPWTMAGDEVGMDQLPPRPMWWIDLPGAKEKLPDYRDDFRELIKWLHSRREHYPPLREGALRVVMDDPEKKLFAFARTLPGDEIIVLINYGKEKQKVYVPTGPPGRWIGVLVPHTATEKPRTKPGAPLDPNAPPPRTVFRVNGSRQMADAKGDIRLWIGPMSARVIVASDKGPY